MIEKTARGLVYDRSGGWCEVRLPGICFGRAGNFHHRQNKSQLGRWHPSNGLHLCGSGTTGCHGWITEHPAVSKDKGWTVLSGDNPSLVPAEIWSPQFELGEPIELWLLSDGGVATEPPFPAGAEGDPFELPTPYDGWSAA